MPPTENEGLQCLPPLRSPWAGMELAGTLEVGVRKYPFNVFRKISDSLRFTMGPYATVRQQSQASVERIPWQLLATYCKKKVFLQWVPMGGGRHFVITSLTYASWRMHLTETINMV